MTELPKLIICALFVKITESLLMVECWWICYLDFVEDLFASVANLQESKVRRKEGPKRKSHGPSKADVRRWRRRNEADHRKVFFRVKKQNDARHVDTHSCKRVDINYSMDKRQNWKYTLLKLNLLIWINIIVFSLNQEVTTNMTQNSVYIVWWLSLFMVTLLKWGRHLHYLGNCFLSSY